MSDSIPNSPSEFFANLPPEKQLLNAVETEIQYINRVQEEVSDAEDDDIFETSIGQHRAMLACWLAANESLKTYVQITIKVKGLILILWMQIKIRLLLNWEKN